MKNQALFSWKDKCKQLKCRLLQFLFGALRVKTLAEGQFHMEPPQFCYSVGNKLYTISNIKKLTFLFSNQEMTLPSGKFPCHFHLEQKKSSFSKMGSHNITMLFDSCMYLNVFSEVL